MSHAFSRNETLINSRAAELRQAFDHSFAVAPPGDPAPSEAFIAIGAGGDSYALHLAEISGLYADKKVTPLPSGSNDLLGLASFRGALVPVYDLRVLLGYAASTMPRWLVLVAPQTPIGLAFDRFDGYLRLPRDTIAREDAHEDEKQQGRQHIAEALRTDGQVRPIVSTTSILESIRKRAQSSASHKER